MVKSFVPKCYESEELLSHPQWFLPVSCFQLCFAPQRQDVQQTWQQTFNSLGGTFSAREAALSPASGSLQAAE